MNDLFTNELGDVDGYRPLADILRPQILSDVVGQDHLLAQEGQITRLLNAGHLPSIIFWGPPGCGKTTIARLLAQEINYQYMTLSAVFDNLQMVKHAFEQAKINRHNGKQTLLFVDEIHRFNKAQQDSFLQYMEDGTITLIGATTENPSFALNAALLSRAQVMVLNALDDDALVYLLDHAQEIMQQELLLEDDAKVQLFALANGDGRYFLGLVEQLLHERGVRALTAETLTQRLNKRAPLYDKLGDQHYNLISALHKSLRGSDCDAALYWFARMIQAGDDPAYIARRLLRFAYEDIGMSDPQASVQILTAWQTYERLGAGEGILALAHGVVYLATAPKSNAVYKAFKSVQQYAKQHGHLSPPKHILNAPTSLMKDLGYAKDYQYDHDQTHGFSGQNYFPDDVARAVFYQPVERGFERDIIKRLEYWNKLRKEKNNQ